MLNQTAPSLRRHVQRLSLVHDVNRDQIDRRVAGIGDAGMDHAAFEMLDPAGDELGGGAVGKRDGTAFDADAALGAVAGVFRDVGAGGDRRGRR